MFASQSFRSERGPADDFWYTALGTPAIAGSRVNQVTALQLSWVWKCVKAIAETVSMLPLPTYRRIARGKERVPDHPIARLLEYPNPWQTGLQWREMMQAHALMRGNGYSEIVLDGAGRYDRLVPLHPDRTTVEVLPNGLPRYRTQDANGRERVLVFGEIIHLQGFSVDGWEGLNPIREQREAIGAAIAARDYGSRYFGNSARPPTWIEAPQKFKDDVARRQWVQDFKAAYGGKNTGTTPVLENGMKLHALGVNNTDAEWLGFVNASAMDIAGIFRVPPHKIGILSEAKWANIEHQQIDWVTDTVLPWCRRWEATLQRDLWFGEGYFAEHLIDMLLRGDTRSRYEAYGKGIQDGWLLRNEAREKENLNPIDGLDEPLEPMNMAPAGSRRAAQERGESPQSNAAAQPPALDARSLAIQTAAAERIARKEAAALQKAMRAADVPAAIDASFGEPHARFVGEVLVLDAERAAADARAAAETAKQMHGAGQLAAATVEDWMHMRVPQLLKLGTEPDKPVTAREMLGLVRAVAQRNVQLEVKQGPVSFTAGDVIVPERELKVQVDAPITVESPDVTVHQGDVHVAAPDVRVEAPITVEAKAAAPEGVMQMQIVSMPERVTQSTIERDPRGQIVTSHQTEKDA